jgi:nucleotide-binding universal stress UspA family protein
MKPQQTFAVGFDGSEDAAAAVRWAFTLAGQVGADVVLVHALGLLEHAEREHLATWLQATALELATEHGFDATRVRWHLDDGDACSVLIRAAGHPVSADLLVVGSRGQGAHAGLLLGSTSLELAEHATIPLVIVPAGRPAG